MFEIVANAKKHLKWLWFPFFGVIYLNLRAKVSFESLMTELKGKRITV